MITFSNWGEWMRHSLELSATIAFTLSGVMTAARSRLDGVGVYAVSFLAAPCATSCSTCGPSSGSSMWNTSGG